MKTVRFWIGFLLSFSILSGITIVVLNDVIMPFVVGKDNVVMVPDVRGLTKEEVIEVLKKHGLVFKFAGQIDTVGVEPGTAVDQDPPPGMHVKRGREIKVTFAREPLVLPQIDTLIVPDSTRPESLPGTEIPVDTI